jgi:hypothetical protein
MTKCSSHRETFSMSNVKPILVEKTGLPWWKSQTCELNDIVNFQEDASIPKSRVKEAPVIHLIDCLWQEPFMNSACWLIYIESLALLNFQLFQLKIK